MRHASPIDLLLPYQRRFFDDEARWKVWCASRQIGKDFTTSGEIVRDCMVRPATTWMYAAPSERQSLESLAKCKEWAEAFRFAIADILEERATPGALMSNATIVFPNKSRIICVPGKPDTVRGFSANVALTEFAFFDDPDATWKAILPSVTNPLRGGEKKVRLFSTPNGKSGRGARFYQIVTQGAPRWSVHTTTIHDAVRGGLPVDVEALRAAVGDETAWAQEFMCEFLDSQNALLPYDFLALAESPEASCFADPQLFAPESRTELFCGIDFGRVNDPTVCWTLQRVGDVLWTREVLVLKGMDTPRQEEILAPRIAKARRVCFDYTGPGIGCGDHLAERFGRWEPARHTFGKLDLCTFSAGFKRELFPRLRRAFAAPVRLRIPVDADVREDLHQMQQIVRNGEYTYAAPRTADGHSDRCTALALALRAADTSGLGSTAFARTSASVRPRGNHRARRL